MKRIEVTYKNGNKIQMECVDFMIDVERKELYLCKFNSCEAMRPIKMDNMIRIESI